MTDRLRFGGITAPAALALGLLMGVPGSVPLRAAPSKPPGDPAAAAAASGAAAAPSESRSVTWMAWGPDPFRKAILRDRLVLLRVDVGWSRASREARAVWDDPALARLVMDRFVPILVDADRRPDLRERYPAPGWPAITVLLPNGVPIYAAGAAQGNPARLAFTGNSAAKIRAVLEEAAGAFADRAGRGMLKATVEQGQKNDAEPRVEKGALDFEAPSKILDALRVNFDEVHGGWTKSPKFPMTAPIEASLAQYARTKDARALEMAEKTLQAITNGPLFDRVEGGVHRIAVGEDWSSPEFEKLLDRNVGVLGALLDAWLITGKAEYKDRATDIVRYLETTLRREGGGYYASQSPALSGTDPAAYYRADAQARKAMKAPPVDRLVMVGWSAKAAAEVLRAGVLLDRADWQRSAKESIAFSLSSGYERGRGTVHALDGETKILPAYLEDQTLFAEAMLQAYQLTADKAMLLAAKDSAAFTIRNLLDKPVGLFGDIVPNPSDPAVPMRTALHPYEWNCRMARLLARLYYLNPQERAFRESAESILQAFAPRIENGPNGAYYGLALSEYHEGPAWAWVVGNRVMPGYDALLAAAHKTPALWKLVVPLDPGVGSDAQAIVQMGFNRTLPPALFYTIGTHTSSAANLPKEASASWATLVGLVELEKTEAARRAARDAGRPEGTPPPPVNAPTTPTPAPAPNGAGVKP